MTINLILGVGCQTESVDSVVDACSVERCEIFLRGRRVEAGEIETLGLLGWCLLRAIFTG